jgi:glyoxylase-like metal-dependent hydrolase (beta-lactamase superfamily II)
MDKITRMILPLAVFTLFASLSPAQQKESPPANLKMISANLYEVLDGTGARGGAYIGDNAVLLVDSKMDKKSVDQTLAEVRKLTDKPVKYLVNTHSDGDHVRGNQFLPDGVIFIAQENCRREFFHANRDGSPSEWNKPELAAYVPSITYRERMDIYLGSKNVQLWYFGVGHTTGDTVVYFPEEKTAFVGDQVFASRPQLIHTYKGGSPLEHIKTLSKMLETLGAERFCSGHDEVLDRAAVQAHIDKMLGMQAKVESLMKQGKDVETIKREFAQNEAALVEAFYQDLKKARGM